MYLPSPSVGCWQGSGNVEAEGGDPQLPSALAARAAHLHCGEGKRAVPRNHSLSSVKRSGPWGSPPCTQAAQLAAGWEGIRASLPAHGREPRPVLGRQPDWGSLASGGPLSLVGSRRDSRWCLRSNQKYCSDVGTATYPLHGGPDAADPAHNMPVMQGRGSCPGTCRPGAQTCHQFTGDTLCPHPSPRPASSGVPRCPHGA